MAFFVLSDHPCSHARAWRRRLSAAGGYARLRSLDRIAGPKPRVFNALEPTWPADDLTRTSFRSRIKRNHQEIASDEAYPFLIFRDDDVLTGGLTLGQVKRGVVQAARLDIGSARHTPGKA